MRVYNVNIGVLGHVDSGKTSLSKCLSSIASTACFDKNPQSKERGITLDLGFSSFFLNSIPDHVKEENFNYDSIQYTLVDCPGHASLIRTVIGGAHIIDIMLLVIDIVKGVQTQTAECLVIGEVTSNRMIIVLNKVDLIEENKRESTIDKVSKRLWKTLEGGKFANCPIVPVSATFGSPPLSSSGETTIHQVDSSQRTQWGIENLIEVITKMTPAPSQCRTLRNAPFLLAVDHCFGIRGQGTVMTGTVLSGSLRIGDSVEIPSLSLIKKVKSMQMFRKPVENVTQGDRVGVCVTQFDPELLERGLICHPPGYLHYCHAAVISAHRIKHYRGIIKSKSKFHISIGHETVMAQVILFQQSQNVKKAIVNETDLWSNEYAYLDQWPEDQRDFDSLMLLHFEKAILCPMTDWTGGLVQVQQQQEEASRTTSQPPNQPETLIIGSRLDSDITANVCRLAFHGRLIAVMKDANYRKVNLPKLKIFQNKSREGLLERIQGTDTGIVKQLFKKETNLEAFCGLRVQMITTSNVAVPVVRGIIEGGFGLSGKVKVRFLDDVPPEVLHKYGQSGKKEKAAATTGGGVEDLSVKTEPIVVRLDFKRFLFDHDKKMIQ